MDYNIVGIVFNINYELECKFTAYIVTYGSPLYALFFVIVIIKNSNSTQFRDFGADKTVTTCWSDHRGQVRVQVRVPAGHLAFRLVQKTIKGFDCKNQ